MRQRASGTRISIRHYVVSAGLREIIEGTSIHKEFYNTFASTYHYDHYGRATWPGRVVDTSKTQYLFRINKGAEDLTKSINTHMPSWKRPIPFSNMVYFGDGETDVPSFTVTRQQGGLALAVYKPQSQKGRGKCEELWKADRVNFFCPADFREGKELEEKTKKILDSVIAGIKLDQEVFATEMSLTRKEQAKADTA